MTNSADVSIEVSLGKEASAEVELLVDFKITSGGCPAHMGSLSYAGHLAEGMEIELEHIFWPIKRWDGDKKAFVDDHADFPINGLPDGVYEAVVTHICENYEDPGPDWD